MSINSDSGFPYVLQPVLQRVSPRARETARPLGHYSLTWFRRRLDATTTTRSRTGGRRRPTAAVLDDTSLLLLVYWCSLSYWEIVAVVSLYFSLGQVLHSQTRRDVLGRVLRGSPGASMSASYLVTTPSHVSSATNHTKHTRYTRYTRFA
ncbi:hypothetical protein F5Y01DRAFT_174410 [Xylaria sp. FL0043]|nr:hypothetical protein F5Y01DRAFT_174410 [Xylaria sp. FL0043]